ncbi:MAG: acetylornithine transaminase [Candidatus Sumerlaeota bacterium]|nr:acetylornithine transaminase [Candidatus Sumerlaeota bacterium]
MAEATLTLTQSWLERRQTCTMQNYGPPAVVLERGEGVRVWDVDGAEYLDLISGIAVNCLGHNHPRLVKAIAEQAGRLIHVSNLYGIPKQIELAERLTRYSCARKAFFCNSGAEAIEAGLKLARLYAKKKGHEGRFGCVSMKNSFHGRTFGALTATGQDKYHKGFEPLMAGFAYAEFNNLASVEAALTPETCAIISEPIQGEGGIIPADKSFLAGLRRLCDERGMTLIFDEVQTGVGRTGEAFGYQNYGVEPDIFCLAKGLAGGLPMGAMLARGDHADVFTPGTHASTFGGNPLACAAALAVCEELFDRGLLRQVKETGAFLGGLLKQLAAKHKTVKEARGLGLMWGVVMERDCPDVVKLLLKRGVLGNVTAGNVIRIAPPLIITREECQKAVEALDSALTELAG